MQASLGTIKSSIEIDNSSFDEIEKGLNKTEKEIIHVNIQEANKALKGAGQSILKAAKLLAEMKVLVKNKNWFALTESKDILISGRSARDLASAYENWLKNTLVPDAVLAQLSSRTLAKIGKVDSSTRNTVEKFLKSGNKCTESDLSQLIQKPYTKKCIDELARNAQLTADNMDDREKLERFSKLWIENIRLKKRVQQLKLELLSAHHLNC